MKEKNFRLCMLLKGSIITVHVKLFGENRIQVGLFLVCLLCFKQNQSFYC